MKLSPHGPSVDYNLAMELIAMLWGKPYVQSKNMGILMESNYTTAYIHKTSITRRVVFGVTRE